MKKKIKKKFKKGTGVLLQLTSDDFLFGDEALRNESRSFAELFDPSSFDSEIDRFLQKRKASRVSAKIIYPPPQESLDLHGLNSDEAEQRVENFLLTAWKKGLRTVRIITGKGIHSEGDPVLRNLMDQLSRALKSRGKIRNFAWENGQREKSGAVILYL